MSSWPRQRGVTDFHHKNGLSLSLMDQGLICNINVTQRGYSKKFCSSFGRIAHITQQTFLIGQIAKMDASHWLRHKLQYLNQF